MNIFKIENLCYDYPEEDGTVMNVLKNINLEIEEGSFTVLLGHNGSGKSTLAKHLNGILQPSSGRVLVNGLDTRDENSLIEIRHLVGMVFQNPDNQLVANVVEEDVAFGPENLGMPPEEIRRRVDAALETVGMSEFKKHAPHLLSGGQKQRVAIAGVLAMQPRCIVLDEPTAMLDPMGRAEVLSTINSLNKNQGISIVLITHHMSETVLADRIIVISDGEVARDGTPAEVFSDVEGLRGYGLEVPETTQLIYELRSVGLDLPLSALTIDDCAKAIYSLLH